MRENIRRRSPEASETQVEAQLSAWLAQRPGALHGDCPGPPRTLPLP